MWRRLKSRLTRHKSRRRDDRIFQGGNAHTVRLGNFSLAIPQRRFCILLRQTLHAHVIGQLFTRGRISDRRSGCQTNNHHHDHDDDQGRAGLAVLHPYGTGIFGSQHHEHLESHLVAQRRRHDVGTTHISICGSLSRCAAVKVVRRAGCCIFSIQHRFSAAHEQTDTHTQNVLPIGNVG